MQSRDFCYWLQGYFELHKGTDELTMEQANTIRNHLNLVFKHEIDPAMGDIAHQSALNATHSPSFNPSTTLIRC